MSGYKINLNIYCYFSAIIYLINLFLLVLLI